MSSGPDPSSHTASRTASQGPPWFLWGILALAATSHDAAVRALGRHWKTLQRCAYLGGVFTVLHWALLHEKPLPALAHAAPVVLLSAYRLYVKRFRRAAPPG